MNSKEELQAAYDKACHGVIAQGKPSINEDGGCDYHQCNDFRCAVGFLLTDDQLDKYSIRSSVPEYFPEAVLKEMFPSVEIFTARRFLEELQECHDQPANMEYPYDPVKNFFVEDFKKLAKQLAFNWNLVPIQD